MADQLFPHRTPSDGGAALEQGLTAARAGVEKVRRAWGIRGLLVLIASLCCAPAGAALAQGPRDDLPALVRELESGDFARREAALKTLSSAGSSAASAALNDFERAPAPARALRAQVIRLQADSSLLALVLSLCGDSSAAVRKEFAGYLGRALREHPTPAAASIERAVAALAEFAASDVEGGVRTQALEALSRADSEPAARALAELTRKLASREAAFAARALSISPRAGGLVLELVQSSFDEAGSRLGEEALAVLLAEGYGPSLAEADRGGLDPRSRRPLFLGGRDPSPQIRAASVQAFRAFLGRAQFLGATARAEEVASALAGEVADPARVLEASALFSLTTGGDASRALLALDRWTALFEPLDSADARSRFDLAVAQTLAAAAQLADGQAERASSRLEAARTLLAGLASESLERAGEVGAELASEVAGERAVVECYALLALLRSGKSFDSPECRVVARAVHELSLRAQLLQTGGALRTWTGDLDSLAQHPHGPFDLLLSNPQWERGLGAHPLDLKLALGRALAAVVPDELPGFDVPEQSAKDLDGQRIALIEQIEEERLDQVHRELARTPADAPERAELENALRVLSAEARSEEVGLHRVRLPSALAIELAGDLRDEGRSEEARTLAARAKDDLTQADFLFGGPYVQEQIARAESIVGSCATDEGKPEDAEKILLGALDRLEKIAGVGKDDLASRSLRSSVLISLAVNANVKLRDTAKALAYFERAFELRQDDFTRTLLACYRARAGRAEEARALLREMPESPYNYYNLACTFALLGDKELALDYLAREFQSGKKSAGAIERQRVWARTDPDLASLQSDPRFSALVGK